MIGFGLRLTFAGGREAGTRLVIIAAAVALGVGLLLTTLAGINAVNAQSERYAWRSTDSATSAGTPAADPLLWLLRDTYFERQTIGRLDVAATGPTSPVPPGIPRLPGPEEFYASPALSALLSSTPADELGDRFPGRQTGTIGPSALPAPNSLFVIVGHAPEELSRQPRVEHVTSIASPGCDACQVASMAAGLNLVLAVVAGALLFPLLMFIGNATRLAAARREQRFAAMRLIGATPRQVSVVAAVEATVSAIAGTALGFGLFFLFRRLVATIPFTGSPFFPEDLSLNLLDVLLVAIGVPAAAAVAARFALRRVHISPLGVTRRVIPRQPRVWRLIPLVMGLAELAYFVGRRPETSAGQIRAFLPGLLVVMVGLVVAGPWLTMTGARVMALRASRPAALIAARRLSDNPKAGFRAVSGLMLALFVTSVAVGVITTIVFHRGATSGGPDATNLSQDLPPDAAQVPDELQAELRSIPGVQALAVVYEAPENLPPPTGESGVPGGPPGLVACDAIAGHPDFGRCAPGAEVAAVFYGLGDGHRSTHRDRAWPTAHIAADELGSLPPVSLVVGTDGSQSAIERARTVLAGAYPQGRFAFTDAEFEADFARTLTGWKQLANVVILASLAIAGSSLAVSVAGGLTDRKRPFSLLRLSGVPLRTLRRVVALESAVPLLAAAVVATGTGFLAAHLFLTAQMDYSLRPPGVAYYVLVLAALAASLGIIASTLPLLRRITGPETARNE